MSELSPNLVLYGTRKFPSERKLSTSESSRLCRIRLPIGREKRGERKGITTLCFTSHGTRHAKRIFASTQIIPFATS